MGGGQTSAGVVVLEALDVALVEVAEADLEQPAGLGAAVAHPVDRAVGDPDCVAGAGAPFSDVR